MEVDILNGIFEIVESILDECGMGWKQIFERFVKKV
jgi:hypothetical protein